jgi:hypothetical protein
MFIFNNSETRDRQDFTLELPVHKRRLDSLAKLLASNSECVAVCVLEGRLFIAANELYSGSLDNIVNSSIKKIMNYIQCISSNKKPSIEHRKEAFKEVCSKRRLDSVIGTGLLKISDEISEKIAYYILENHGNYDKEFINSFEKESAVAALACDNFSKLYVDFSKLEQSIKNKFSNTGKEDSITDEQLTAFSSKYEILYYQDVKNVHAESQIVDHIINLVDIGEIKFDIPSEIYIGISKLCCMNCRSIVIAASKILKENNLEFVIRGKHDLDFKFIWPKNIKNCKTELTKKIFNLASELIEELLKKEKPTKVSMSPNYSISSNESARLYQEKIQLQSNLKNQLNTLNQMKSVDLSADKYQRSIELAIFVQETDTFNTILSNFTYNDIPDQTEVASDFSCIFNQVKTNYSKQELIEVLTNPDFMGKNVAIYFEAIKFKIEPKNEGSNIINDNLYTNQEVKIITPWMGGYEIHSSDLSMKNASLYKDGKKVHFKK